MNHRLLIFMFQERNGRTPMAERLDTHSRALKVNLDPRFYGTFAEIGAGQEVARSSRFPPPPLAW